MGTLCCVQCVCVCCRTAGSPDFGHHASELQTQTTCQCTVFTSLVALVTLPFFPFFFSLSVSLFVQLGHVLIVYAEVSVRYSQLAHSAVQAALCACLEGAEPHWLCENLWRITVDKEAHDVDDLTR